LCHVQAPVNGTLESAHYGSQSTNRYTVKPLLYEHRTHHYASTGAGFARTTVSSTALLAIPPHVGKQYDMHVNYSLLGL
jgi:hypothetical protein